MTADPRTATTVPPAVPDDRVRNAGGSLVSLKEIREAARALAGVARRTPLFPVSLPTGGPHAVPREPASPPEAWLKCENLQHVSAFKLRGAYNFVRLLEEERRRMGLVTYSSGNHAQGVAFAARAFGIPATVVMPEDVPPIKLEATRALGAEVELAGTTSPERQARAEEIVSETGAVMVPPFDHPHIIAGQGTVGLEVIEQLSGRETPAARGGRGLPALLLVPVGGGGLISGIAAAVRAVAPGAKVIGVEPEGAASMAASLAAGRAVTLERVDTLADGLKPVRPGDLTLRHCQELVERVVTVSDEEIVEGVRWLFGQRLVVEPSGGAAVAALLAGRVRIAPPAEGATVAILSGGNLDPALLARWVAS
ncbi:MAG: threonine/serine dehydratase [Gemmatimonadota bacterium]